MKKQTHEDQRAAIGVCNRFSRTGDLAHLGRHFRRLNDGRRRFVVDLMQAGFQPETAIATAKRSDVEDLLPFFSY